MPCRNVRGRRRLVPVLAGAMWLVTAAAFAQGSDPVAHCRDTADSDAARIACLEDAIVRLMVRGREAATESSTAKRPEAAPPAQAAETASAAQQAEAAPAADLGAEQLAARARPHAFAADDQRERLTAGIVEIRYTATGRPVFTLDNGQVWRGLQPDPKYQRFTTKRHKTVEIWDSRIGGYRLKVGDVKRVLQVERIQ